jgi:hypothetical protein
MGALRLGLRRALAVATIDASRLGHRPPGGVAFPPLCPLDLRQPKQDTRDHAADGAAQVNLRRPRDHSYVPRPPVGHESTPIWLPSCQPVALPDDDHRDRPRLNRALQPGKGGPVEGLAPCNIFKPLPRWAVEALGLTPAEELGFLAVGLLRSR